MIKEVSKEEKEEMLESIGKKENKKEAFVDMAHRHNKMVRDDNEEHPGNRLERKKWQIRRERGAATRSSMFVIRAEDWERIFSNNNKK